MSPFDAEVARIQTIEQKYGDDGLLVRRACRRGWTLDQLKQERRKRLQELNSKWRAHNERKTTNG